MANLAIIPARGGSKRIPRKNIRDFLGKPIIAYSVAAAIESRLFSEVMVSTDDEEIALIAKEYGASVPFMRSANASDDHAPLADVIEEVKACYASRGREFTAICCILPTAPLVSSKNLVRGFEFFKSGTFDSVRPVVAYPYPIQRALRLSDGSVELFNPEFRLSRSQDLEPAYHDAGQFYWMKYTTGLRSEKRGGFIISELESQDIDNESDWKLAEMKYKLLMGLEV